MDYKLGDLVTITYATDRIGIIVEIRDNNPIFPYAVKWIKEELPRIKKSRGDIGHYSGGVLMKLEPK